MEIKGLEWTREARIIAALVIKLGGDVTLEPKDLESVGGLLFVPPKGNEIRLQAGKNKTEKLNLPYINVHLS